MSEGAPPLVMLVDDTPANLKLLDAVLRERGCEVRSFTAGAHALQAASRRPPDLILLDIAMPELDGFEVCRRLKADPAVATVPVIFLTALDGPEEKLKAFRAGGVDYVTKPFQVEELWARVSAQLRLRSMALALEAHNRALDALVAERTAALADAHRRLEVVDRAKTDFLRLMSHELRTPLNGLFGLGELLLEECPPSANVTELATMFRSSRVRLMSLIENAELLTQVDVGLHAFAMEPVPLLPLLRAAIADLEPEQALRVMLPPPRAEPVVQGEARLLRHAFRAVLKTALGLSQGQVGVAWETGDGLVMVRVVAPDGAISPALLPHFFDVLGGANVRLTGGDLGLAPSVAHRVFSLFEARLTVESVTPTGVQLTVTIAGAPG